jgi:hypothetical protein
MKCTECKYHSYIGNSHFCDIVPEKPTRVMPKDAEMDVPCDKYEQKEKNVII